MNRSDIAETTFLNVFSLRLCVRMSAARTCVDSIINFHCFEKTKK